MIHDCRSPCSRQARNWAISRAAAGSPDKVATVQPVRAPRNWARVQTGGAVAEERVQHLAADCRLGGVELGGEPRRVAGGGVGELHQLGVALHHVQHPADQVPISRHLGLIGADRPGVGVQQAAQPGQLAGQRHRLG